MYHSDPNRMNLEGAFAIKEPHVPQFLYKYRDFTASHIDALERLVLYRARPSFLNDPFEGVFRLDTERFIQEDLTQLSEEGRRELIAAAQRGEPREALPIVNPITARELRRKLFDQWQPTTGTPDMKEELFRTIEAAMAESGQRYVDQFVEMIRGAYSIVSLSEVNNSVLMWSHYSNSHQGFAIEYDTSGDDRHKRFLRRLLAPVIYRRKLLDITRYMSDLRRGRLNNLSAILACSVKSYEWSYEKEWRLIFPQSFEGDAAAMRFPVPSALILGVFASEQNEAILRGIAERHGIPVRRMHRMRDRFGLEVAD